MDELEISGKRYISARRAAKENKYTPDYIGQLIRGQKLKGQKVGRAWYVSEESLRAYLRGEDFVGNSAPQEVAFVEEAPTLQPVEGRGPDQSVGVEEQKEIKTEPEPEPEPEPVAIQEKEKQEEETEEKDEEEVSVPLIKISAVDSIEEIEENDEKPKEKEGGLRYVADDWSSMPTLEKKTHVEEAPAPSIYIEAHEQQIPAARSRRRPLASVVFIGLVGAVVLASSAALSSRLVLEIEVQGSGPASAAWALK